MGNADTTEPKVRIAMRGEDIYNVVPEDERLAESYPFSKDNELYITTSSRTHRESVSDRPKGSYCLTTRSLCFLVLLSLAMSLIGPLVGAWYVLNKVRSDSGQVPVAEKLTSTESSKQNLADENVTALFERTQNLKDSIGLIEQQLTDLTSFTRMKSVVALDCHYIGLKESAGIMTSHESRTTVTAGPIFSSETHFLVAVTCSTFNGAQYNLRVETTGRNESYSCICAGVTTLSAMGNVAYGNVDCYIHAWACPVALGVRPVS